jgi:hypothetical protein
MSYTKQLLFSERFPELNGNPLFANAADLARKLVEWGLHGSPGKERVLGSLLAQVITANSRSCPPALRSAILGAVGRRADEAFGPTDLEALRRRVERAFDWDDEVRRSGSLLDPTKLYNELLQYSEASTFQFIVTARTAEEVGSEDALNLTEVLLRRTGLLAFAQDGDDRRLKELVNSDGRPPVTYVFNLPSEMNATEWWQNLSTALIGRLFHKSGLNYEIKRIQDAIIDLNQREVLVVQAVPPSMCAVPCVVYNPHLYPSAAGFVLYYHSEAVSMARMDPSSLGAWMRLAFSPIMERAVPVHPVPYVPPTPTGRLP